MSAAVPYFQQAVHAQQFGQTLRYHTELTLKSQDVGQHSFNAAWLCWLMAEKDPSVDLIMSALAHDAGERKTGDMPSPTKRQLGLGPQLDSLEAESALRGGWVPVDLTDEEQFILKAADLLDGCFYCLREAQLGNRLVFDGMRNGAATNFMTYTREHLSKCKNKDWPSLVIALELFYQLTGAFQDVRR